MARSKEEERRGMEVEQQFKYTYRGSGNETSMRVTTVYVNKAARPREAQCIQGLRMMDQGKRAQCRGGSKAGNC